MSPNSQVKKEVTVQQSGRKGEVLLYKEKQSCCCWVNLGFTVIYGYVFASSLVRHQSQVRKATNISGKCKQIFLRSMNKSFKRSVNKYFREV